jgi:tetratricopeptide (TPR) repeat protein
LAEAMRVADSSDEAVLRIEMLRLLRRMPSLPEIPEEARKHALRGEAMIQSGEFESAVGEFRTALKIAPYVAKLHFNAALLYANMKKFAEAVRSMKNYLEMAPDAPDARSARDEIYKWEYALEKEGK